MFLSPLRLCIVVRAYYICQYYRSTLSSELRNKKEKQEELIQQLAVGVLVCVLLEYFVVYSSNIIM